MDTLATSSQGTCATFDVEIPQIPDEVVGTLTETWLKENTTSCEAWKASHAQRSRPVLPSLSANMSLLSVHTRRLQQWLSVAFTELLWKRGFAVHRGNVTSSHRPCVPEKWSDASAARGDHCGCGPEDAQGQGSRAGGGRRELLACDVERGDELHIAKSAQCTRGRGPRSNRSELMRSARAKGAGSRRVLFFVHVLRGMLQEAPPVRQQCRYRIAHQGGTPHRLSAQLFFFLESECCASWVPSHRVVNVTRCKKETQRQHDITVTRRCLTTLVPTHATTREPQHHTHATLRNIQAATQST